MIKYSVEAILLFWGLILSGPMLQAKSNQVGRHALYGFEVPYPKELTNKLPAGRLPFFMDEKLVFATLNIDDKGKVVEVRADKLQDSLFVNYYQDNLKQISFEPARIDGKKASFFLPLQLRFQPNRRLPDLYLPVDSNRTITDRDLYLNTFAINGITLPSVETFPSYFCDLEWSDSLMILPFILLSLELDEGGELTEVELVSTNYPAFALQLESATLSAEFQPLSVNDQYRACSCFLLISFFPQLRYPTEIWRKSSLADYSVLEKSQVRLFPDTVGFLTKPLPRFFPPDAVTISGQHNGFLDTIAASVAIDSLGELNIYRYGKVTPQVRQGIQKLNSTISFFPAMDYSGNPRNFYGMVKFIFSGSAEIRIKYLW